MATYTEPVGSLNVTDIYKELMKASTGQDSTYIKAKETLLEYFETDTHGKTLSTRDKAELLSNLVVSIAGQTTAHMLDVATKIAIEDRDSPYVLAKMRADTELTQSTKSKMVEDIKVSKANAAKITADTYSTNVNMWKAQADIYTKNGISLSGQSISNAKLASQIPTYRLAADEVQAKATSAGTYTALVSGVRKDGVATVEWTDGWVTDVVPTTTALETLTGAQTAVAVRQEAAFDDNMRQHAANSSANMIGILLSTDNSSALSDTDVDNWRNTITYLSTDA